MSLGRLGRQRLGGRAQGNPTAVRRIEGGGELRGPGAPGLELRRLARGERILCALGEEHECTGVRRNALDELGVRNRYPDVHGLERDSTVASDTLKLTLTTAIPQSEIRYTLDGTEPTRQSTLYTAPFKIVLTPQGVQVTAKAFLGDRRASPTRAATFRRSPAAPRPIVP